MTQLTYVIRFVGNMKDAVAYYRDTVGLPLKFELPEWSEFATGATTLALHAASQKNPAGTCEIGLGVGDITAFYNELRGKGVHFTQAPQDQHGHKLTTFTDLDGAEVSVSGK